MTAIQLKHGPFAKASPSWIVPFVVTCDVVSRVEEVKSSTDLEWLGDVVKRAEQKTVRKAAASRIAKLMKAKKGAA